MCDIRATLTRMAFDLTAASLVGLLLLPFFGPLLDHHFPERRPGHSHVYLGPADPDHIHPYEASRHDHHHPESPTSGGAGHNPSSDGILYLTSHDGVGTGFIELTVPAARENAVFPDLEEYLTALRIPRSSTEPRDLFVSPPRKPPRA